MRSSGGLQSGIAGPLEPLPAPFSVRGAREGWRVRRASARVRTKIVLEDNLP